jgi:hypothetical protein
VLARFLVDVSTNLSLESLTEMCVFVVSVSYTLQEQG